jgi:hypothetical protein
MVPVVFADIPAPFSLKYRRNSSVNRRLFSPYPQPHHPIRSPSALEDFGPSSAFPGFLPASRNFPASRSVLNARIPCSYSAFTTASRRWSAVSLPGTGARLSPACSDRLFAYPRLTDTANISRSAFSIARRFFQTPSGVGPFTPQERAVSFSSCRAASASSLVQAPDRPCALA